MEATQRFRRCVASLLVAAFFFALAFFVGLPVLPLRPQKFSFSFTLGSMAYMNAFVRVAGGGRHRREKDIAAGHAPGLEGATAHALRS